MAATSIAVRTMKAAQIAGPGADFELVERDVPEPGPGQVRIKVQACGICYSDALTKDGHLPGIEYPRIPGHEVVGPIDALGDAVSDWELGQRVGVGWHGGRDGNCVSRRRGDFRNCLNTLDKILYTLKAHTTGGRDGGSSRTDDGRLEVALSDPGTSGTGTNPEQLFAVGWSACFLSAIKLVAGKKKVALPSEVAVDAEIDLGLAHGGHHLAARLNVNLPGVAQQTAEALVEAASHICPYSLATKGNIDVKYNVIISDISIQAGRTQHAEEIVTAAGHSKGNPNR